MYHEHPIRILKYSVKNLWLLIFPMLRGLLAFTLDVGKFYSWLKGAWFDIMILGAIIIFGLIRWHFSMITVTDEAIVHTEGVFVNIITAIPYKNLSSVTLERSFYLRPFKAMKIYCDTSAGIFNSTDMKLIVSRKVCREITKMIPGVSSRQKLDYTSKPKITSIVMFSVFFSSSFSGAVYLAAFFFKGGDLAKDIIAVSLDKIAEETSKIPLLVISHIPAAAIGIGSFFLVTWMISFVINMIRYYGFAIRSDGRFMEITCGALTRHSYKITEAQINYADLRQNLIMKLCKSVAVNINCAGYGASNSHIPVIFPIRKEKSVSKGLESVGICSGLRNEFRPGLKNFWAYIWAPTITALCIYPAYKISPILFPRFAELTSFAVVMAEIPALWMVLVKIAAAATSGISVYEDKIMIRYSGGFRFHTIVASRSRIAKISITQTPFQKAVDKCTVGIYFNGEQTKRHFVKALSCADADKIAFLLGYENV